MFLPVKSLWSQRSGQGGSCYSHFTDGEAQLRSERFSGVGLNILNITGHLLGHWKSDYVQEHQWWLEINPLLGCGCLGVSSCPPPCPLSVHSTLSGRNVSWTLSFGILHFFLIHTSPGISRTWFFLEGLPVRMGFCLDFSLPGGVGGEARSQQVKPPPPPIYGASLCSRGPRRRAGAFPGRRGWSRTAACLKTSTPSGRLILEASGPGCFGPIILVGSLKPLYALSTSDI